MGRTLDGQGVHERRDLIPAGVEVLGNVQRALDALQERAQVRALPCGAISIGIPASLREQALGEVEHAGGGLDRGAGDGGGLGRRRELVGRVGAR